jgi:hypothetical protein
MVLPASAEIVCEQLIMNEDAARRDQFAEGDLARLVATWPTLTDDVRAAILGRVDGAGAT